MVSPRNGKWSRCPWCGRRTFGKTGTCMDCRWLDIYHGKGFSDRKHGADGGQLEPGDVLDESTGKWLPRHNGILEWVPDEREAG